MAQRQWQTYFGDKSEYTPQPVNISLTHSTCTELKHRCSFKGKIEQMMDLKMLTKFSIFRKSDEIRIDITLLASETHRKIQSCPHSAHMAEKFKFLKP